jgi:hypothetical protein
VIRYSRANLPEGLYTEYRKLGVTLMIPMVGPFTVLTKEGKYVLSEGWQGYVALDKEGHPYPIDAEAHASSYERVED